MKPIEVIVIENKRFAEDGPATSMQTNIEEWLDVYDGNVEIVSVNQVMSFVEPENDLLFITTIFYRELGE